MIDPKPKWYTVPEDADASDLASSHGMMLEMIGSEKRVLEFGCASGYMSRWLAAAGCRVTGVEVDGAMAARAREICDEVIVADLDTRRVVDLLPGAAFDVAVFGDVLEHLRDPWRVLDETRSLLAEGGSVVISIPNIAHGNVRLALLRGSFDYQELGLLDNTHLRFFTLKTVQELCLRAGYRIERLERTKAALFASTDTMPKLDPRAFDPDVIAEVQRDPEHDTFQFIIRAVPLTDEQRLDNLVARLSDKSSQFDDAIARLRRLEAELAALRERAEIQVEQEPLLVERSAEVDRQIAENQHLRERIAVHESELRRLESALEAEQQNGQGEIRRLELALEAERQEARREMQRLERSVDAEQLKAGEADEALRETVALFLAHANSELEAVRSEIVQVNRAIHTVQKSWIWMVKLRLRGLRDVRRRSLRL